MSDHLSHKKSIKKPLSLSSEWVGGSQNVSQCVKIKCFFLAKLSKQLQKEENDDGLTDERCSIEPYDKFDILI